MARRSTSPHEDAGDDSQLALLEDYLAAQLLGSSAPPLATRSEGAGASESSKRAKPLGPTSSAPQEQGPSLVAFKLFSSQRVPSNVEINDAAGRNDEDDADKRGGPGHVELFVPDPRVLDVADEPRKVVKQRKREIASCAVTADWVLSFSSTAAAPSMPSKRGRVQARQGVIAAQGLRSHAPYTLAYLDAHDAKRPTAWERRKVRAYHWHRAQRQHLGTAARRRAQRRRRRAATDAKRATLTKTKKETSVAMGAAALAARARSKPTLRIVPVIKEDTGRPRRKLKLSSIPTTTPAPPRPTTPAASAIKMKQTNGRNRLSKARRERERRQASSGVAAPPRA